MKTRTVTRTRVCDYIGSSMPSATFEGTLYAQFQPYFEYLVDSEHSAEMASNFHEIYVKNEHIERPLRNFVKSPKRTIVALTGPRGIGKSTTLRYLLGVGVNPSFYNDTTIIIPFFMDQYALDTTSCVSVITAQILAAAELVRENAGVQITDGHLYKFIKNHKNSLMTPLNLPVDATIERRLEALRENNPYAYAAEILKYSCQYSNVKRVMLIVDDIESASHEDQSRLVKGVMRLRECLKNTGSKKRTYNVDYLFSCRHATFNMLRDDPQIDGFSLRRPIRVNQPVPLNEIMKKRFACALKDLGRGRIGDKSGEVITSGDLEEWQRAYDTFEIMIGSIVEKFGEIVTHLSNNDLRRSMAELLNIFENSRWYESGHDQGSFDVFEMEYRTTEAGIFRAMVLGNTNCYSYDNDACVTNLFYNFKEDEADLMLVHMIMLFFEKARHRTVSLIVRRDIEDALETAFSRDAVSRYLDRILVFMEEDELIKRESIRNGDDVEIYHIPQTKLFESWKMLKMSCVLCEFFRDVTFMERNQVIRYHKERIGGTSSLRGAMLFAAMYDFVDEIATVEQRILTRVRRRGLEEAYRRVFGGRGIARHLFSGVNKSVRRYYNSKTDGVKVPSRLVKRRGEVGSYIKGVYGDTVR